MENRIVPLFTQTRSQFPSFASVRWKRAERWRPPSRLILSPPTPALPFNVELTMNRRRPNGRHIDQKGRFSSRLGLILSLSELLLTLRPVLHLRDDNLQHQRLAPNSPTRSMRFTTRFPANAYSSYSRNSSARNAGERS